MGDMPTHSTRGESYLIVSVTHYHVSGHRFELCGSLTASRTLSYACLCLCVGVYERMKVDQRKFGKASWTAAVERMERLRYSVAKETLQLQRAREICLDQRKHTLREEVW